MPEDISYMWVLVMQGVSMMQEFCAWVHEEVEGGRILLSPAVHTGGGEEIRPLLVSDPAYKVTNWCMKPYPETRAVTLSQQNFNKALSWARVVIQQAFGMLKGR